MEPAAWVAIVLALIAAVVTPVVSGWQRSKEKKQDWARQDALATELREHNVEQAALLAASQQEAAGKVDTVAAELRATTAAATAQVAQVAEVTQANSQQLVTIKELVDGGFTAQLRRERLALRSHAALITKNAALSEKLGIPPDPDLLATLDALDAEIRAIDADIAARVAATS